MATTHDAPAASGPTPHRFTVDDYYRMAEAGILRPEDRVELIEGIVVDMNPIGPDHMDVVDTLVELFFQTLGGLVRVRSQGSVRLGQQVEPEPAIALVRRPEQRGQPYRLSHPTQADIYLLVEVADSSLAYDLGEKARLYARYGIADYWVLDLPGDRLVVHRQPGPEGYASVVELRRGATVSPLAFPRVTLAVDEMLG